MSRRRGLILGCCLLMVPAVLVACKPTGATGSSSSGGFEPRSPIEMIVPFSAGGGVDLAGRTVVKILQDKKIVKGRFDVNNVDGGSGLVGMSRLKGMKGSGNAMMVTGSHIVATPLLSAKSGVKYTDFTPLATIYTEYVYFFVKPDSDIKDLADLASRLKANPSSVSIGGSVPGGASNLGAVKFVKSIGVNPDKLTYVPYDGDEAITAVLGGKVDVVTAGPEGMDLVKAGKLRAIAVSSAQPLTGRDAGVPTWSAAGSSDSYANFRILSGPPDMPSDAVAFWKDALTKMSRTDEWQKAMETNGWAPFFKTDGLDSFLAQQNSEYKDLFDELGILNG